MHALHFDEVNFHDFVMPLDRQVTLVVTKNFVAFTKD